MWFQLSPSSSLLPTLALFLGALCLDSHGNRVGRKRTGSSQKMLTAQRVLFPRFYPCINSTSKDAFHAGQRILYVLTLGYSLFNISPLFYIKRDKGIGILNSSECYKIIIDTCKKN